MRLGLTLSPLYGPDPSHHVALAREAEAAGFDSVWTGEAYGSDAATLLTWLAAHTERIGIGSAIFQIPARSAAMTAMTAATLDALSGGRLRLGLGPSGAVVSEGLHGVAFGRQLARTRDYVAVVRAALAGERVQHDGPTLTVPLPGSPGRPLRLTMRPVQEHVPLLLAAIGPRALALAGEIADGWLGMFAVPEHFGPIRAALDEGAARAGRTLGDDFDLAPCVPLALGDDLATARDAVRGHVALYVGVMGPRDANPYAALAGSYGYADAAAAIQDHYLSGRRDEAIAAVPDGLIDLLSLVGPADRVRDRLEAFRAIGTGTLQVMPMGPPETHVAQLRALSALA